MLLDHAALLTSQATVLTANFFTHHLSGPRKPSWPIQLTLMCAAMRTLTDHTHLVDVEMLRRFINLPFAFTPSDIIVTPVSFKVLNRGLKGMLGELEEKETGIREISCEWVVPKSLWRKINEEFRSSAANSKHIYIDDDGIKWSNEKVILYVHGGAYYLMSAKTHREINYRLSKVTGRRVFAINYRLAPEGPFPCGLHDAVHSFLYLIDPNGLAIQPENIVVAGDSAGGGLALALLFYLRDNHMPLPGGAVLFSPWVDLTMSCASWDQNQHYDYLFKQKDEDPLHPVKLYLHPHEERAKLVTHPYVSPLFGDLNHLPPLLIQCGDSEVLRDEIYLLAHKASETGTTFVQHEVYEDMVHVFQMFNFLEPATKALDSVGYFVKNIIPIYQRNTLLHQANRGRFSMPDYKLPRPVELTQQSSTCGYTSPTDLPPIKVDKSTSTHEDGIIVHSTSNNPYSRRTKENKPTSAPSHHRPMMNTSFLCSSNRNNKNNGHYNQCHPQRTRPQPTIKPLRSSSYPDLKQLYTDYNEHPAIKSSFVKSDGKTEEINDVDCEQMHMNGMMNKNGKKEVSVGVGPDR
ncbi:6031_t:CDS:2 [Funneliformis geosporum]|uniref:6031_t:CDS:1 n=1 Tax=Funneliformis geosporum TaxID=1117311 RepID=A0A9W4ST15_9GLOM|nr:6031_t:CDS:2 [Funneliformis geosporum]